MAIKYVFSADRFVMFSVVHDPLTICDLINWWARVKTDLEVLEIDRYVQLVDVRHINTIQVSRIELRNFLTRVSKQARLLPRRSAIWTRHDEYRRLRDFGQRIGTRLTREVGITQEVLTFVDLDIGCHWLGANDYHVRQADSLFIDTEILPATDSSVNEQPYQTGNLRF